MIPFVDLKREYSAIREEIQTAIAELFEKGVFVLGENVRLFEEEFARYVGCEFGVGVANGTDAVEIALRSCGVKQGDEVITVPNTAVPTVSAIVSSGAKPVFVDIDEKTMLMDLDKIEEKITPRTKAIVPVHLYGQPVDMHVVLEIAKRYGLCVVEDCAQAHGAQINGRKVGSFGDASAFSFYPTKNLGTYGDGGIVVTNSLSIRKKAKLLRNYGFEKRYETVIHGVNSRLDELHAVFLRVKLRYLEERLGERIEIANRYDMAFPYKVKPYKKDNVKHVYHLYVIRSNRRDELSRYLKDNGVLTAIHYPIPIHLQKAYENLGYKRGDFPVARRVMSEILSIPLFIGLSEREQNQVISLINQF